ncbi:MAG TPA: alpha/beta hydrolase, partial [Planctomycetota bacterium]|nr:alpha/beta hydrolase [Planctomycetota bacterium]
MNKQNDRAMALRLPALALLIVAAAGCSASSIRFTREGGYPGLQATDECYPEDGFQSASEPSVFRVAIDACGHLYPDPKECAPEEKELGAKGSCVARCLGSAYGGAAIAERFAEQINARCGATRKTTLMILVHGFGNAYPVARRSFELARMRIAQRFPGREFAFLEVYWDGKLGSPLTGWGAARRSSKWAGLGLRALLRGIDERVSMRAISHSRGASVLASALWNVPLLEEREENERFAARQKELAPPRLASIRLGWLSPAMPETDVESMRGACERIVMTVNENDPALGKGLLPATMFGSTALGCD